MPMSDKSRKHALECLRLEADCRELARRFDNPTLKSHFSSMAREWSRLALHGVVASEGETLH